MNAYRTEEFKDNMKKINVKIMKGFIKEYVRQFSYVTGEIIPIPTRDLNRDQLLSILEDSASRSALLRYVYLKEEPQRVPYMYVKGCSKRFGSHEVNVEEEKWITKGTAKIIAYAKKLAKKLGVRMDTSSLLGQKCLVYRGEQTEEGKKNEQQFVLELLRFTLNNAANVPYKVDYMGNGGYIWLE